MLFDRILFAPDEDGSYFDNNDKVATGPYRISASSTNEDYMSVDFDATEDTELEFGGLPNLYSRLWSSGT